MGASSRWRLFMSDVSFKGTDAERSFVHRRDGWRGFSGRISDLLKFLVPKVGESFVLDHNVESQEVAQARPRPELAGALETILELAAL